VIEVPQRTLNTILQTDLSGVKNIDILKIDIEGGELKCLKGIDFEKYKAKIICLENICKNVLIKDYLEKKVTNLIKKSLTTSFM